ncbi:ribosomal protein S18-alanine N-acetyltransferase [Aerococcus urinaeequi]|uniref:ribosomal protein S18-alanine N-acetyltransferase n=1 Tax=Aerococcus urinaeequi TaxID=51665 RepID=UPI003D6A7497
MKHSLVSDLTLDKQSIALPDGQSIFFVMQDTTVIHQMVDVEYRAYHQVMSWTARDFLYDMTQNPNTYYIQAFLGEELVGFIGCRRDRTDVHISNFVVNPDYQSIGIGTALLDRAIDCAKQLDRNAMTLEVRASNHGAQRFYQRFGFYESDTKENYYSDNDEDAFEMRLAPLINVEQIEIIEGV